MTALIIIGVLVLLAGFLISIYNKLVKLRNGVKSSWSDIDVQLKKRYNLVPGLVETVKGYAKHESSVFEKVTQARSSAMQSGTPGESSKTEGLFTSTLKTLFAVSEAYPDLKANQNFMQFQQQFTEIEGDIESARRYYNAIVRDFNNATETFPSVIFANMFGFKSADFFEIESDDERNPIKPDFS